MAGDGAAAEFAELLRKLKERGGLSYGVLGKRLHTSASTLHRYVNGDVVPTDYAPVERFARVCRATPEELVELHRRWVLADALRGQKGPVAAVAGSAGGEAAGSAPESVAETVTKSQAASEPQSHAGPEREPEGVTELAPGGVPEPRARRRRRAVALAGAAVVAAVVSTTLVVNLVPGDDDHTGKQTVGSAASSVARSADGPAPTDAQHTPPSASDSRAGGPTASASRGTGTWANDVDSEDGATAPTVATNPYTWQGPCSQHYLVKREPAQVPPPPLRQEARGWVTALGGVAGENQMLALTVQGSGKETVVLEALHVRVVQKATPLAWNDYAMGVGCGGDVPTKSFDVDLDAGRPDAAPKSGQRDFPYKVSETDPEVFYVTAHARAHDVSWYLELEWSSGDRGGTVRIDDQGQPFRTSGSTGRPAYDYPLGGSEWQTAITG